jgi:hypothetical protein
MRLLIFGSTASWALERHYVRHLSRAGWQTEVFDPSRFIDYSILNRIRIRAGSLKPYHLANQALLERARQFSPDIIWVFKGVELLPETLKRLKDSGCKLANYNPDHPFIRTSVSHGGDNVAESVPLYDLHFCYGRELASRIQEEYGIPGVWLPFGYELDEAGFDRIAGVEEIRRICFIGNPDDKRARVMQKLVKKGLPVDVFGANWKKHLPAAKNAGIFNVTLGEDFWKNVRRYRVQLNIFRPHNEGSHNMRTFEIPAAGGVMLAPDSPEHLDFFQEGKEAFFYRSEEDLETQCRELLESGDVTHIRENARLRTLQSGYAYEDRAKKVSQTFENL